VWIQRNERKGIIYMAGQENYDALNVERGKVKYEPIKTNELTSTVYL